MKIILLQNIKKLGNKDDVVSVKNGYALNFLIPQKMAVVASEDKIRQLEINKQKSINKKQKIKEEMNKLLAKLKDKKVVIKKDVSPKGKLFAALTLNEILAAIKKDLGVNLDKNQVKLKEHTRFDSEERRVKEVGEHEVELKIGGRIVSMKIEVVRGN